jgi:hypothetical protein
MGLLVPLLETNPGMPEPQYSLLGEDGVNNPAPTSGVFWQIFVNEMGELQNVT